MSTNLDKSKRGKSRAKCPGELGKPRNHAEVVDFRVGLRVLTGTPGTDLPEQVDLIANREYYDERIRLLAKHYGIGVAPEDRPPLPPGQLRQLPITPSVVIDFVQPPDGAFWRELCLKLLKDHVPCFMPGPAPRSGAPPTRQASYAGLDLALRVIKEKRASNSGENTEILKSCGFSPDQLPTTEREAKEIVANRWGVNLNTVHRDLNKWRRKRRGGIQAK